MTKNESLCRVESASSKLTACLYLSTIFIRSTQAEPFIGQFELKTLESASGMFEFQSQNAWAWDHPARRFDSGPADELVFDENSIFRERYALELEIGFSEFLKMRVGVEAERERIDEPHSPQQASDFDGLSLQEIGAEIVAILLRRESADFGLGVVAEIEGPLDQEEPSHLTLGPIIEYQSGDWLIAAVPMLVHSFGGERDENEWRDDKWDFAYAAQVMRTLSDRWSIALEGYGTVERLGSSGNRSLAANYFGDSNQHRLGPVVYFSRATEGGASGPGSSQLTGETEEDGAELTIGLGVLEGLNSHTADHTLKLSFEVDF
ncbi:MAG: hypothetical protein ACREV5_21140 [Steroidobacter sp.]